MNYPTKRRSMLKGIAALLISSVTALRPVQANKEKETKAMESEIDTIYNPPGNGIITGNGVGDFDFLSGE